MAKPTRTSAAPRLPTNRVRKFRPAIGRDFAIEEIRAKESYETAQTRNRLALLFSSAGWVAIATASVHGLLTGNFSYLLAVWAVCGPIVVGIASYYFGRGRKDSG